MRQFSVIVTVCTSGVAQPQGCGDMSDLHQRKAIRTFIKALLKHVQRDARCTQAVKPKQS